jgi:hypothetical protein
VGVTGGASSEFGPWRSSRAAASTDDSPVRPSVPRSAVISSTLRHHGSWARESVAIGSDIEHADREGCFDRPRR